MATKSPAKIAAARSAYGSAKRAYKTLGKKAFGKPKSSTAHKAYESAKRTYRSAGRTLGKLTGLKARRR